MANSAKSFTLIIILVLLQAIAQAQPIITAPTNQSIVYIDSVLISWSSPTAENRLLIYRNDSLVKDTTVTGSSYTYFFPTFLGRYGFEIIEKGNKSNYREVYAACLKNIPGGLIWFRPDFGIVADVSGRVSAWNNAFGPGNNAVQTAANRQPVLTDTTTIINNYKSLRFDGMDDFIDFGQVTNFRTLFVVAKHATGSQNYPPLLGSSTTFDFAGEIAGLLFNTTFSNLNSAKIKVNNNLTGLGEVSKPIEFSIISIQSPINLAASNIGNDRNVDGRYWNGNYLEVIGFSETLPDMSINSIKDYIRYKYAPPVYLGQDTIIHNGICPITLGERDRFIKYNWSTGDTTPIITINKSGSYRLTVTDVFGLESTDTINVIYRDMPVLFSDTSFCTGDTLVWNTGINKNDFKIRWSNGSQDSILKITTGGKYVLTVVDKTDTINCKIVTDTVNITMDNFGNLNPLVNDTTLCKNSFLVINSHIAQQTASYQWSDGTNQPLLTVDTTGRYSLILKNSIGCTLYDSINITVPTGKVSPKISISGPDTLCMGTQYVFSENSIAGSGTIDNYRWVMDEGDTAIFKTINKTYNTPGSYVISLLINTNDGCVNQLNKNIEVLDLPSPNFTVPALNCAGSEIPFTDISDSRRYTPLTYKWKFGEPASGASDSSSLFNPTHRYASGGIYNIMYEIIDRHACKGSINKNITVQNAPLPNFTSAGACAGSFTNITDNTYLPNPLFALSYSWDLGDGTFNSTRGSIQKNYGTPGEKDVKLTVTANNGCSNTITKTIKINAVPQPGFTVSQACAGQNILMTDTSKIMAPDSITGIRWRLSGTEIGTGKNLLYRFNTPGTYTVEAIVSTGVCSAGVFKEINVLPGTAAGFDFNPKFGEAPLEVTFNNSSTGAVNYSWIFDEMTTSEEVSPVIVFADEKDYIIKLIATNEAGCSDTATRSLPVRPDNADLTIKNLSLLKNDFGGQPVVEIENAGNVTLTNALINIYDQNEFAGFSKEWTGELAPGQTALINLNINISTDKDFICATVDLLDGIDKKPENNSRCIIFEKSFKSFYPYPQPVIDGNFTLPLLLPEEAEISIELIDMAGKSILKKPFFLSQGFHKIPIYVPELHAGIYALVIINGTETEVRKLSVHH